MNPLRQSRRAFACRLLSFTAGSGLALRAAAAGNEMSSHPGAPADGLVKNAEAIHQEIMLNAPRARVYRILTDSASFDAVVRLSDAAPIATAPGAKPTSITAEPGGAFALFGGYISGRNLELVPDVSIVQAWRSASWPPGEYSIAKFVLNDAGAGTRLVLDHGGFPAGAGEHLVEGWHLNYWEPLAKLLAKS